jgi:hypothetical protein
MEVVILTGRSILLAGASNDDTLEVIVMKAELAALCAFKATTPPAVTTGAAHTGKRARVQHRLPKLRASGELSAPSAPSNSGEKVRELSVSRATSQHHAYINKCKSNEPSTSTSARATSQARKRTEKLPAPSATSKGRRCIIYCIYIYNCQ